MVKKRHITDAELDQVCGHLNAAGELIRPPRLKYQYFEVGKATYFIYATPSCTWVSAVVDRGYTFTTSCQKYYRPNAQVSLYRLAVKCGVRIPLKGNKKN